MFLGSNDSYPVDEIVADETQRDSPPASSCLDQSSARTLDLFPGRWSLGLAASGPVTTKA